MDSLVPFLERSPWPSSWARCKDSVPTPSADAIGRRNAKCWGLGSPKRFLHRYTDTSIHRVCAPIHRYTDAQCAQLYANTPIAAHALVNGYATHRYSARTDTYTPFAPIHRHKRSDQRNGINSAIGGNGVSAQKWRLEWAYSQRSAYRRKLSDWRIGVAVQ